MAGKHHETEIKLRVASAAEGRRRLRAAGFRLSRRRVFETNTVFDTPSGSLRQSGSLLRLREAGGRALVTYKGPATVARHKSREELETTVGDAGNMRLVLARLGFAPAFRYEKYRAEYSDGRGAATLDETPVGCFVELEGDPEWIDSAAVLLGFAPEDYITASYLRLYLDDCARHGRPPGNMTFPRRRGEL